MKTLLVALIFCMGACGAEKFSFGTAEGPTGFVRVEATALYSDKTGYGFEPGTAVQAQSTPRPAGN